MASYEMKTVSGLDFYVCSSAFQKFVRRGLEHEALWYGTELYMSGYDEYVWGRIRIIVSEDIGLANPMLLAQIDSLYSTYTDLKKKKNKHQPEKLQFIHAIMLIARSPKSRLVDNKVSYYFDLRNSNPQPEIPDYVYDMHTLTGKIKGRGNDHFYEEAALINNVGDITEEFSFRDMVWELYKEKDRLKKTPKSSNDEREETQIKLF